MWLKHPGTIIYSADIITYVWVYLQCDNTCSADIIIYSVDTDIIIHTVGITVCVYIYKVQMPLYIYIVQIQ